jgi:SH3 domain-containing YSC84-like protein 1
LFFAFFHNQIGEPMKYASTLCLVFFLTCLSSPLQAESSPRKRPNGSNIQPKKRIIPNNRVCDPNDLHDLQMSKSFMDRVNCVAVIPSMKKGGLGIGGQWGRGVASCRYEDRGWSAPIFFTLTGGSFGFQYGFQWTDLVMLISTRSGLNALLQDKVEIGAGASATALLFGRGAGVSTDALLDSRIISYARSRGLFLGLELRGAYIKTDDTANCVMYGERLPGGDPLHAHDILTSERVPDSRQDGKPGEITSFQRALRDVSPARAFYVRVLRPRTLPPPSAPPR